MRRIGDSSSGLFQTRRDRPIGPARRLLTREEKQERSRAYTRACRAKALREHRPDNTALRSAVFIAYLETTAERKFPGLLKRIVQILVDAGYDGGQVTAQINRAQAQMYRLKHGIQSTPWSAARGTIPFPRRVLVGRIAACTPAAQNWKMTDWYRRQVLGRFWNVLVRRN